MTRAGAGANQAAKRAKVFARVKGFRGKRKNCFTIAVKAYERSMQHEYIGRKLKKRDMRKLWITRIGIASRLHGLPYSRFVNGLAEADVALNRKVLSELSIHEPRTFAALVEVAKRFAASPTSSSSPNSSTAQRQQQASQEQQPQAQQREQVSLNGMHWTALTLVTSMLPSLFA